MAEAAQNAILDDPEPILVQSYLPMSDRCHGADMPVIERVWYHPVGDEI
jgi:hypothetical protein